MNINLLRSLGMSLLIGGALVVTGCDTRPVAAPPVVTPDTEVVVPPRDGADVKVDIGNGRGVQVDVDRDRPLLRDRRDADVDVDIGGPRGGVKVDVD